MQYSLHWLNFQFILSALGHHFDSRIMNIGYFISDYLVPAFYEHCYLGLICQILFSFILTRQGFCFFTMSLDLEETCQTYTISRLYIRVHVYMWTVNRIYLVLFFMIQNLIRCQTCNYFLGLCCINEYIILSFKEFQVMEIFLQEPSSLKIPSDHIHPLFTRYLPMSTADTFIFHLYFQLLFSPLSLILFFVKDV